jgi:hypothetical protein
LEILSGGPNRFRSANRYAVLAELPVADYLLAALNLSEAEKQENRKSRQR